MTPCLGRFDVRSGSDNTANGIELEPTKYIPSGVTKLYEPKCALVGARMRAFGSRGLGVSTFPGKRDGHA
ncbi:hypothetical protein CRG98_006192 [Punica granatum]|uniref:Uncharacterized protein n=1 Tax=Punica granatum TaxID=22663 RepID=A0A2I0KY82_PUNGR|nr:hypothetical protein CRG98_006192 [Punica granatum]